MPRSKAAHEKPRQAILPRVSLGAVEKENLPLPVVYYPNHYGTFFGFAQDEEAPMVMCTCSQSAVENLFCLVPNCEEQTSDARALYFPQVMASRLSTRDKQLPFPIEFVSGVCHRCNLITPSLRYCHEMYGTRFIQSYGWYVNQTYLRLGMLPGGSTYLPEVCPPEYQLEVDKVLEVERKLRQETERLMAVAYGPERENISDDEVTYWRNVRSEDAALMIQLRRKAARARRAFTKKIENTVRQEFGFRNVGEGWVSETLLYQIVRKILSDCEVIFHHRPNWLEGLELDIYVPALKIGFEYQGIQHFRPVEAWGGEPALKKTRQRDAKKASLCTTLGIRLITVDYTEPLTEDHVSTLLAEQRLLHRDFPGLVGG